MGWVCVGVCVGGGGGGGGRKGCAYADSQTTLLHICMKTLNKNQVSCFRSFCVLCFHRQPFRFFIHIWRMFCYYLFLISPSFGALGRLLVLRDCGIFFGGTFTYMYISRSSFSEDTCKTVDAHTDLNLRLAHMSEYHFLTLRLK